MLLGVDIGGTAVKMAFLGRDGLPVSGTRREAPIRGFILDAVEEEIDRMIRETGEKPDGIAVSATGLIDDTSGRVIGTDGRIEGYDNLSIPERFGQKFGVRVTAINDANAAVLGEAYAGAAKGAKDVVMITLGTGVGGGVICGGKLMRGRRGIAGEMGHFTLYQDGEKCTCGKRGCYENYASVTALVRRAQRATGETGLNGRVIFSRAQAGDEKMLKVLDGWMEDIAAGLSGLIHIFNPEVVLIGGGVSAQEELLMKPLREKVLKQSMACFADGLRIERAKLGNDAGMIGAGVHYSAN